MIKSKLIRLSVAQANIGLRVIIRNSSKSWNARRNGDKKRLFEYFNLKGFVGAVVSSLGLGFLGVRQLTEQKVTARCNSAMPADRKASLQTAVEQARDLTQRLKDEVGLPGVSIAVSVNGQEVWSEGFGYSDVENRQPCHSHTVMRIASISKPMTMAIVARLWELGKLDIDLPVQRYLPQYGEKIFDNKKVTLTTRMLLSHMGGIRHYDKNCGRKPASAPLSDNSNKQDATPTSKQGNNSNKQDTASNRKQQEQEASSSSSTTGSGGSEFDNEEYYLNKKFKTVRESLAMFENDELCSEPGTKYLYTTHGWTLVSAVAEAAAGVKFTRLLKRMFKDLGLTETCLDKNEPIIYGRSRYYVRNKSGRLVNAPHVDNSYKWAGGGILSTVHDLLRFGNVMLYSYQHSPSPTTTNVTIAEQPSSSATYAAPQNIEGAQAPPLPGYLRQDTVVQMWTPVEGAMTSKSAAAGKDDAYGLGWVVANEKTEYGCGNHVWQHAEHTGGAVGASSVLLILPLGGTSSVSEGRSSASVPPEGVVVAVLTNLQGVGLKDLALDIAHVFRQATSKQQLASSSA